MTKPTIGDMLQAAGRGEDWAVRELANLQPELAALGRSIRAAWGSTDAAILLNRLDTLAGHEDPAYQTLAAAALQAPLLPALKNLRAKLLRSVVARVAPGEKTLSHICANWRAGLTDKESAKAVGLSAARVKQIRHQHGWKR